MLSAAMRKPLLVPAAMPPLSLQHAWYELVRVASFCSLAITPGECGHDTLGVACAFATMAALDAEHRVLVVNAKACAAPEPLASSAKGFSLLDLGQPGLGETEIALVRMRPILRELRRGTGGFTQVIVATDSPLVSAPALITLRDVDACVLCVLLGQTRFARARQTVEMIGRRRVVGSVTLRPCGDALRGG